MRLPVLIATLLFCLAGAAPVSAQAPQSGWKLPNLNPFASKSQNAFPQPAPAKPWWDPLGVTTPFTAKKPQQPFQPPQPTMLEKMTKGTKDAVTKTADFLNPFDDAAPQPQPARPPTGLNSSFGAQMNGKSAPAEKSGSWFQAPWSSSSSAPQEREHKDVNSFLSGKRPGF